MGAAENLGRFTASWPEIPIGSDIRGIVLISYNEVEMMKLRKTHTLPVPEREPAMQPTAFIESLYEVCLGRAADLDGLQHFVSLLAESGDPTRILSELMNSDEYQGRVRDLQAEIQVRSHEVAVAALAEISGKPQIVDVGAQQLGAEGDAYFPLTKLVEIDVIGFDPLAEEKERAANENERNVTILPYAIGDGTEKTLHINNDDATSSIYPLNTIHNEPFRSLSALETVRTERHGTHHLDEVLGPERIDFLKLDIQGGELDVLKWASRTLRQSLVVHCEVEFSPIYLGQPLYPEVQRLLNDHSFYLIDIFPVGRYSYKNDWGLENPERLLWGDAVFFRTTDVAEELAMQALIAAAVYEKPTLAAHLLQQSHTNRSGPDSAQGK